MPYLLIFIGCLGITTSSIGIHIPYIQQLDTSAVIWMSQHRNTFLDGIAVFLSHIGGLPVMLLLIGSWVVLQLKQQQYASCLFIALGLCGASLLGWLGKFYVDRPRPDTIYQIVETYGASFPSAHSIYATVLSCLIMFSYREHPQARKITLLACLWWIGMGISRVYLGAHFPTDVIAGWSIAFIWIAVLWLFLSRHIVKQKNIFREKSNEVE